MREIPGALGFGYFGVSSKGFRTFVEVAQAVRAKSASACKFVLVGHVNRVEDEDLAGVAGEPVAGITTSALSTEEYARRAKDLSYAVWTARPEMYRFRASTAFLDGLSFVKPGIYLRNRCLEYYFRKMGDIGYLCDSVDEMEDVIVSIVKDFPHRRYAEQCENILKGRRIFEPDAVGEQLRGIVDSIK